MSSRRRKRGLERAGSPAKGVLEGVDATLLDIVDHVLTKGIVLSGDVVLGVADVELVYLRLSAVLCAFDRVARSTPTVRRRNAAVDPAGRRAP